MNTELNNFLLKKCFRFMKKFSNKCSHQNLERNNRENSDL